MPSFAAAVMRSALFSSVVLFASSTRAGDAGVQFSWNAPAGCPTSKDVEARIAARLGRAHVLRLVHAQVSEERSEFRVHVREEGRGERTIVAPTCEAAADAVAVIVALATDEKQRMSDEEQTTAEPARTSASSPPLQPSRAPSEHERAPEPSAQTLRWSTSLGGAIDSGSLPRPTVGLGVGMEARRGSFSGRLRAFGFLPQTEHAETDPPVQTQVWLIDLMATGCAFLPATSWLDAGGCAGAGLGLLRGESARVSHPDSGVGLRPQGIALGEIRIPLSTATALRFDAGALIDPVRSPFRVGGLGDVYRPAAVALRTSAVLELRFR